MKEIITDPDFATLGKEKSRWTLLCHKGVEMQPTVKGPVLSLKISQTLGANWHGEFRYSPFSVQTETTYTVSFSARAKHPFKFSVWLGQQNKPWKSLVREENHFGEETMTDEWKTFAHTWRPFLKEPKARLNFVLGQIDNVVEIKDVSLTEDREA